MFDIPISTESFLVKTSYETKSVSKEYIYKIKIKENWVLNPWSHPPPILIRGGSSIWARIEELQNLKGNFANCQRGMCIKERITKYNQNYQQLKILKSHLLKKSKSVPTHETNQTRPQRSFQLLYPQNSQYSQKCNGSFLAKWSTTRTRESSSKPPSRSSQTNSTTRSNNLNLEISKSNILHLSPFKWNDLVFGV